LRIQFTDRSRLFLVALALVILMALLVALVALYVPAKYTDKIQSKWVEFGVITSFLVVFSMRAYWKARKSFGFWGIFLSFLALHLFGVGHLWAVYNGLSILEVGFISGAEILCLALTIYWVLGVGPDDGRHFRSPWIPKI
jgi:uncharacterized membrane protein